MQTTETTPKTSKKNTSREFVYAIGRRKGASARVRLYKTVKDGLTWGEHTLKKGVVLVNQKQLSDYFSSPIEKAMFHEPLRSVNALDSYGIMVKVAGGGRKGQLEATILGVSRALSLIEDGKHRPILKRKKLLRVDARVRERRKVGTGGKARRKKQSPKR